MRIYILAFLLVFLPQFALAGSQTYSTAGSHSFTVPSYATLTVTVWAGGGGASNYYAAYYPGQSGGSSSFNGSVIAYGGATSDVCGFGAGAGGTATGGDSNYTGGTGGAGSGKSVGGVGGNGANGGGSGGAFDYSTGHGLAGSQPGGGGAGRAGCDGAGGGGASVKTYTSGQLTVGGTVSVVVGAGGIAGVAPIYYTSGAGAPGQVTITWTDPPVPTCSVTLTPNPLAYGSSSTLTYSSTNATTLYINNIGYVSTSGGSTSVSPSSTTNYSCTAVGAGGTGTQTASLTVNAPAMPTTSITSSLGATVLVGESSTITATFSAGSGDTLTADNIDSPVGTGVGANENPTTPKTYIFSPSSAGTYTFYARAKTAYYTSWTTYSSVVVTVPTPPTATLSLSPSTIAQGETSTLSWSSANATSCTISGMGSVGTSGSTAVSPSESTTYTGSCTGTGGTTSFNIGLGATLSVSCTPAYSCSSQTIQYTDAACAVSDVTTCVSPEFCSSGSATCLSAPIGFTESGGFTGHLQAAPLIVPQGTPTTLYWNVDNVESCTVTGNNGDSFSGASSGAGGQETAEIEQQTVFTLSCDGLDGTTVTETQTVNILPVFNEQ